MIVRTISPAYPRYGPKTAVKWLEEQGSLQAIIAHADTVSGKIGDNLRASLDMLPLAKQLVTLDCDIALPCTLEALHRQPYDASALIELFKRLEFKQWLKDLLDKSDVAAMPAAEYPMLLTRPAFEAWMEKLQAAPLVTLQIHTTMANSLDAEVVGISLAIAANQAVYVPLLHNYLGAPEQLSRAWILAKLAPLLEDESKTIVSHDVKHLMNVLAKYGIEIGAQFFDTMLESYVLDSSINRHDVASLALKYLGKSCIGYETIAGKGVKQLGFQQIDLEKAGKYAAEQADLIGQVHAVLGRKIAEHGQLVNVLTDIELPLAPVLSHMERTGVCIDAKLLAVQSQELAQRLQQLEQRAYQLAGVQFNLASPKQLQEILYTRLGLPVLEKTPTGAASTSESVLQELALNYPLPKVILEHRSLSKIKSTYTDSLPRQIHTQTGRVHTSYNQAVTSTGRLSSTDPNLQNIPIRTEEGRRIR